MATMTFDTRTLQDAMAWVINHVDAAPSHLGDSALLISAPKDGHVVLAGGRDQSSARARTPFFHGEGLEEEKAIHAHTFSSIVKNAPDKTVELNFTETGVIVTSGKAKSKVNYLLAEEAQAARAANTAPRQAWAEASELSDVMTSLSSIPDDKDVSRPQLAGLKVKYADGKMSVAATDQVLLGANQVKLNVPEGHPDPESLTLDALVPNMVMQAIVRTLPDEGPVWFHWDDTTKRIAMSTDNYWVSFGLLGANDKFPPYEPVLNVKEDTVIVVDRKALTAALSRAGHALGKDGAHFGLISHTEDEMAGEITIKASGAFTHEEELPAEVRGETIDPVLVGAQYLLRAVKSVKGDTITVTIGGNRIKVTSDHSDHAQFVFMSAQSQ